jgi:hypothetical protein
MSGNYRGREPSTGLFRRKQRATTAEPPTRSATSHDNAVSRVVESPDRQRTKARYETAAKELEDAVKGLENIWGSFEFPELRGELEGFDKSQFQEKINKALETREHRAKDRRAWGKCRHVLQSAFVGFSPFAKTFLTIAKDGQSVIPLLVLRFLIFIDSNFESIWIALWRTTCVDYG